MSGGVAEKDWLDAQFDGGEQGGDIDRDVTGNRAGDDASPRRDCGTATQPAIDKESDERHRNRQIERVRANREDAAIAEEKGLDD